MENSPLPPPLPVRRKRRVWIVFAVLGMIGLISLGALGALGTFAFRRAAERRASIKELENKAHEERERMADAMSRGEIGGGDAAIERMKGQLEKSAAKFSSGDAAAARALGAFLSKMQIQVREYEASAARLTEANVFSFAIRDRSTLEAHRQIVRDFLTSNAKLTDTLRNAEQLARAELDAANIPAKLRETTMAGFNQSQATRPLQLRIRAYDQTLGDAALATHDLLEKNWGKWSRDKTTGQIRFEEDATLSAYNALIEKVQTAADEQGKVQAELVARMRSQKTP